MRMVNPGFPERAGYGFEMVDTASATVRLRNTGINRKFTPNQISRSFGKISAI